MANGIFENVKKKLKEHQSKFQNVTISLYKNKPPGGVSKAVHDRIIMLVEF